MFAIALRSGRFQILSQNAKKINQVRLLVLGFFPNLYSLLIKEFIPTSSPHYSPYLFHGNIES